MYLTSRGKEERGIFESLQEERTMNEYGNVLGRLVCMYLRMLSQEEEFGAVDHDLTASQRQKIQNLKDVLIEGNAEDGEMDAQFHTVLTELFLWKESHKLLEVLDCPVQHFLVYASVEKGAKGFINAREIGRLCAKLIYGVRCCLYTELMMRCEGRLAQNQVNEELGGLMVYAKEQLQTPFGFLLEMLHFASSVAGEAGALPQVSWLGIESGMALAIHGKRVELGQLRNLCSTLLTEARNHLEFKVKMGIKTVDWTKFEPEDDLTNILDHYSFVTSPNNSLIKDRACLLQGFMANAITRSFFTRGMNGNIVLWEKKACMEWLKRCKMLLEMLAVLCHLLGGQPARASELATLRWRNSVDEQRGVYWVNGTVMLLAMYTKTRSITRKNKLIPR
jgi:hypothetical protein